MIYIIVYIHSACTQVIHTLKQEVYRSRNRGPVLPNIIACIMKTLNVSSDAELQTYLVINHKDGLYIFSALHSAREGEHPPPFRCGLMARWYFGPPIIFLFLLHYACVDAKADLTKV